MFTLHQEHERPELAGFVGSNLQQSGIMVGYKEPDTVIVTSGGRHGKRVGYTDKQFSDGSWLYIGQGGKGDQDINSAGNKLLVQKRNVLLFSTREPNAGEVRMQAKSESGEITRNYIGSRACLMWLVGNIRKLAKVNAAVIGYFFFT